MFRAAAFSTFIVLFVSSSALGAETFVQQADPAMLCQNEDATLSIWRSQSTVLSLDYTRKPASLTVDGRRWLQLPQNIQASVALSAYCRLEVAESSLSLEVRNQGGNLLGTVKRGAWHNRLTDQ